MITITVNIYFLTLIFRLWTIYQLKKILNTDSILRLAIWSKALVGSVRFEMLFQAAWKTASFWIGFMKSCLLGYPVPKEPLKLNTPKLFSDVHVKDGFLFPRPFPYSPSRRRWAKKSSYWLAGFGMHNICTENPSPANKIGLPFNLEHWFRTGCPFPFNTLLGKEIQRIFASGERQVIECTW